MLLHYICKDYLPILLVESHVGNLYKLHALLSSERDVMTDTLDSKLRRHFFTPHGIARTQTIFPSRCSVKR